MWCASTDGKIGVWSTKDPKTMPIQGFTPGKVSRQLLANRSSSTRSMLCNSVRISPQKPAEVDRSLSLGEVGKALPPTIPPLRSVSRKNNNRKGKTKSVNILSKSCTSATTKLAKEFHFI